MVLLTIRETYVSNPLKNTKELFENFEKALKHKKHGFQNNNAKSAVV